MTQQQKGTLFVFIASVFFSLGGLCVKVIPWNPMAINGGRTAIALVVIGAYLAAGLGLITALGWTAFSVISLFL